MKKGKHVMIEDIFDKFRISFSVFTPLEEAGDEIKIIGSIPELQDHSKNISSSADPEPLLMADNSTPYKWLYEKYYKKLNPWKLNCIEIQMPQ